MLDLLMEFPLEAVGKVLDPGMVALGGSCISIQVLIRCNPDEDREINSVPLHVSHCKAGVDHNVVLA